MTVTRIRVGKIARHQKKDGSAWDSAIAKNLTLPAALVTDLGIAGDEQADRRFHGGKDKAILLYSTAHYALWQADYGELGPAQGSLGENLEVSGVSEETVCVGDVFTNSEVVLEVSQPRQPCWKPAAIHSLPDLTARMLKTGRTGWYVRVLRGGQISSPSAWQLISRPNPTWSVSRASMVRHFSRDSVQREALAALDALSDSWKADLKTPPSGANSRSTSR